MSHYLLFDLDDTLYSPNVGLFSHIAERINNWLVRALDITPEAAAALRHEYFMAYGTTLNGLVRHHPEVDIEDYLDDVHRVEVAKYLAPNPALAALLTRLPGPRVIFTNATADWAERVLQALGIRAHFARIVDIRALNYQSKPAPVAYARVLTLLAATGPDCLLFDDQPRNLRAGAAVGMRTVLVHPGGQPEAGIDFAVPDILAIEPVVSTLGKTECH